MFIDSMRSMIASLTLFIDKISDIDNKISQIYQQKIDLYITSDR